MFAILPDCSVLLKVSFVVYEQYVGFFSMVEVIIQKLYKRTISHSGAVLTLKFHQ